MKVLFLSHQSEFIYGGEVCTLAYMQELVRQGVEVHFAAPPGPYADRARAMAKVHEIPSVQFSRKLSALPRFLPAWKRSRRRLREIISAQGIEILHATSLKAMVYAWPLRKELPIVWHHHDILPSGFWNALWLRALAAGARLILVPSPATKEALAEAGVSSRVLPNGFDPAEWQRRPGRKAGPITLGFVGEISRRKGADLLGAILTECRKRGDFRLWVIGEALSDPAFGQEVQSELASMPVKFWGLRPDVKELLQEVDILLVPSRQDPLPTVIVEAGLSGVPVVASPSGGIPGMISHNGALADGPEEYAARIAEILGRWEAVSVRARESAEARYNIRNLTKELIGYYRSISRDK